MVAGSNPVAASYLSQVFDYLDLRISNGSDCKHQVFDYLELVISTI